MATDKLIKQDWDYIRQIAEKIVPRDRTLTERVADLERQMKAVRDEQARLEDEQARMQARLEKAGL